MIVGVLNFLGNKLTDLGESVYGFSPKIGWFIFSIGNILGIKSKIISLEKSKINFQKDDIFKKIEVQKLLLKKFWECRCCEEKIEK